MNFVNSTCSRSLSACSAPVRTCAVSGRAAAICFVSCSGETPFTAATEIESYWPSRSSSFCAVGMSKTENVAVPSEPTSP